MSIAFAVGAIVSLIIVGASLLTLVGIVMSLGSYDKVDNRKTAGGKTHNEAAWPESIELG